MRTHLTYLPIHPRVFLWLCILIPFVHAWVNWPKPEEEFPSIKIVKFNDGSCSGFFVQPTIVLCNGTNFHFNGMVFLKDSILPKGMSRIRFHPPKGSTRLEIHTGLVMVMDSSGFPFAMYNATGAGSVWLTVHVK